MKLSQETLNILKNFVTINQSLRFKPGNVLATVSGNKNIYAEAEVPDNFPVDFSIYDLNELLGVLSLHSDDLNIEFGEKELSVISSVGKTTYRYTNPQMFVSPPEGKKLPAISEDIKFILTAEALETLSKITGTLKATHLVVQSQGAKINLVAKTLQKDDAHTHTFEVGKGNGAKYSMVYLVENLKMLPGDYDVVISKTGPVKFTNKNNKLFYFITAVAKESKYGG